MDWVIKSMGRVRFCRRSLPQKKPPSSLLSLLKMKYFAVALVLVIAMADAFAPVGRMVSAKSILQDSAMLRPSVLRSLNVARKFHVRSLRMISSPIEGISNLDFVMSLEIPDAKNAIKLMEV